MAKIVIDIENCKQCPLFYTTNQYSTDGFDRMEDWMCKKANKKIRGAVEWHEEKDIKIPDWCPCIESTTPKDATPQASSNISNYHQVVPMTRRELREYYDKLKKEDLIEMLIANNAAWNLVRDIKPATTGCIHTWFSLPSLPKGVFVWQCFYCGAIMKSNGSECQSAASYSNLLKK